jgi:hypothetical protein
VRILWVATKCPWPATDGGRLVLKNTVEALAAAGERVTVVCPGRAADVSYLRGVRLRTVSEASPRLRAAGSWLRFPAAIARHASPPLARETQRALREEAPDVVFAEQAQALPSCEPAFAAGVPVVLRAQNVESDLWRARAAIASPVVSRLLRFEARRLERWEGDAVARCAAVAALTARDASRLRALARGEGNVIAIPAPFPGPLPESDGALPGNPALVMLAGGGWWANEDGARWFLREIWPSILGRRPAARLHLFGALRAGELPAGVSPHPAPADSRDVFVAGTLFVVALRAASGVRMKILEAWARGVPVIATPEAAAGLESLDGVRLASGGDEFAAAVDELADRPEAIRRLVEAGRRDLALFHDPPAVAGRLIAAAAEAAARPQGSPSARTEERRSSA